MGFRNLSGVELQSYALELAKSRTRNIHLVQGSILDLPFEDRSFDLIFTSRVLIHISPEDLARATSEVRRCTDEYIWGLEYYSPSAVEVNYREHSHLLWKMNYPAYYRDRYDDLELIREQKLPYLTSENVDSMFLLRRTSG
jgi:pseudaminic acid biosynthesis-associated methylase